MGRSSVGQKGTSFCDAYFLTSGVQHQIFAGILSPCLSDAKFANAYTKEKPVSKKGSSKEERCVKNNYQNLEWIVPDSTRVSDVFSEEALKEVPAFRGDCKF